MEDGDIGATLDHVNNIPDEPKADPPAPIDTDEVPLGEQYPNSPVKDAKELEVQGFQLVQATGLMDTSTPEPKGSSIPSFATPSPSAQVPKPQLQSDFAYSTPSMPTATSSPQAPQTPFEDNSKSKQFNQRFDYMIAEFFSRQVSRLTAGAPEAIDRNYRIFQQRFKERLGSQWAHITSQPEVDEAIRQVQTLYNYFEKLEKIIGRQVKAIQKLNDCDTEVSLYYQQEGLVEPEGPIRDNLIYLGTSYHAVCQERVQLIQAYETYLEFLTTFKTKAIGDSIETMKKQHTARLELDSYGSKLGQLEERKLKTFARSPMSFSAGDGTSLERELEATRTKFQDAKTRYQSLSTQLIDKAGLLEMKKMVDFGSHLQRVREGDFAKTSP
ncbi:Arfaptin-like domain-containing protein [Gorgonomyces haynaldii]|nr:Arfaptin-like domain-containing protein [Gorgonomyces haynaldii]